MTHRYAGRPELISRPFPWRIHGLRVAFPKVMAADCSCRWKGVEQVVTCWRALSLFAALIFAVSAGAAIEQRTSFRDRCVAALTRFTPRKNPIIWALRTEREKEFYESVFLGMNSKLPPSLHFDARAILSGRKSILSLGEGDSNYIASLLSESNRNARAYAVDGKSVDDFAKNAALYPGHYIEALFQYLNLIDSSSGKRAEFDEIVSLFSFSFLLNSSQDDHALPHRKEHLVKALEHVLAHLAAGGSFRIYPSGPDAVGELHEILAHIEAETGRSYKVTLVKDFKAFEPGTTNLVEAGDGLVITRMATE